jgi:phage-related baseplate assembly protein
LGVVTTDAEQIKNEMIASFESHAGRKLYPADPWYLKLMWFADIIIQERVLTNHAALMNLLRYAEGEYLDALCEVFFDTKRLQATAAKTTLRFGLSETKANAQTILAGTRVSRGNIIFASTGNLIIPPGTPYADVAAVCETAGAAGNGYLSGQISEIVDVYPFYGGAVNITATEGGSDVESDESLRERARLSLEAYSTAGSEGAYIYWAKSIEGGQNIADVYPFSPAPCEVDIKVLMQGGELPGQEILDAVLAACNAKDKRPLTDIVTVSAPDTVPFDVEVKYWIKTDATAKPTDILASVTEAVNGYVLWQTERMGRDIDPGELNKRVREVEGVKRASIVSPSTDVVIRRGTVAQLGAAPVILFMGGEEE